MPRSRHPTRPPWTSGGGRGPLRQPPSPERRLPSRTGETPGLLAHTHQRPYKLAIFEVHTPSCAGALPEHLPLSQFGLAAGTCMISTESPALPTHPPPFPLQGKCQPAPNRFFWWGGETVPGRKHAAAMWDCCRWWWEVGDGDSGGGRCGSGRGMSFPISDFAIVSRRRPRSANTVLATDCRSR